MNIVLLLIKSGKSPTQPNFHNRVHYGPGPFPALSVLIGPHMQHLTFDVKTIMT